METRLDILKRINWDYTYSAQEIDNILRGEDLKEKKPFLIKILKSVGWYDILRLFSEKEIREMLSPEILNNLHIASLREKYQYARRILYQ